MILVDFNQVTLSNIFMSLGNYQNAEISEDMIRHMILNSLRSYRRKFFSEYGELVICCDGRYSWRREAFPYYKAGRKKSREESDLDWTKLFEIIKTIKEELTEHFPYKVLYLERAEADDIIGALAHRYGNVLNTGEKILILSADKDFIQLLKYGNVRQYDPIGKKWIEHSDPDLYLAEHVFKGDRSDGIPNVLSQDNSFVVGERQKPITKKRLEQLHAGDVDELTKERIARNKTMVDLEEIPKDLVEQIYTEFDAEHDASRRGLYSFFVKKRLNNLLESIGDF